MTLSTLNTKHIYTGNSSTKIWDYTFTVKEAANIKLYLTDADDVITEITTNFSVNTSTSKVTYPVTGSAITSDYKLTIIRVMDLTQDVDLDNQGPFDADALEEELDREVMISQQMQEQLNRAIKWPISTIPTTTDTDGYLEQLQAEKTAAETAATASQTAQGLSETARDASIVAKVASQAAQALSEAARDSSIAAKVSSESARDTAITNAGTAITQAGIATTQAGIATTQAGNAATSAGTATTQAGIATAQAGIATTQAGNASTSAGTATTQAGIATTQAGTATTQAGLAATSKSGADSAKTAAEAARDAILAITGVVKNNNTAITAPGAGNDNTQGYSVNSGWEDTVTKKTYVCVDASTSAAVWKERVHTDATQTLTNKTFDDAIIVKEIATPSAPSTGYIKYYAKGGFFYKLKSTGTEALVGGGGSGPIIQWSLTYPLSPMIENVGGIDVWDFNQNNIQGVYGSFVLPSSYIPGNQITLESASFATTADSAYVRFCTTSYLIRSQSTTFGSYPNSYNSTNPQTHANTNASMITDVGSIDLSDANGNINSVAAAAGDKILFLLMRTTDVSSQAAADARLLWQFIYPKYS
jgi:hypothetical protein